MTDAPELPPLAEGGQITDRAEGRERVISIRGLRNQFGDHVLHDRLDFDVFRGETVGLVGGSGSGKSVLLRTVVGLNPHRAGRIEVLGDNVDELSSHERERLQTRWGVLFQDGALFSSLTVAENIELPLREHARVPTDALDDIAALKVSLVGLPLGACAKRPSELSGGMRKRAGLARALALDPELLFLDEPTAGLDPISAANFDKLLRDLQRSLGLTVLMVTHDLDSLNAMCDRIAVLLDKRIVAGTMEELLEYDHPWVQEYFRGPRGRAAGLGGRH